jgi:hypothetical protein
VVRWAGGLDVDVDVDVDVDFDVDVDVDLLRTEVTPASVMVDRVS